MVSCATLCQNISPGLRLTNYISQGHPYGGEENTASIVATLLKLIISGKVHKSSKYHLWWKKQLASDIYKCLQGACQQQLFIERLLCADNVPDGGDTEVNKTVSIPAHTDFTSWRVWGNEPLTYTKTTQYIWSFQTLLRDNLKWDNLTQSQQRWHLRCDWYVKKGNSWWGRSWQICQERKVQRRVLKCTSKL